MWIVAGAGKPVPAHHKSAARALPKAAVKRDDARTRAVAEAIRMQAGGQLNGFYAKRGYWPLWVRDGTMIPETRLFLRDLGSADLDGVKPGRFDVPRLRRLLDDAGQGPDAAARAELALSGAFVEYVREVRRAPNVGVTYLDPDLSPKKQKPEMILREAELATPFSAYVAQMGWMSPLYAHLREALARSGADKLDDMEKRRVRLTMDRLRILPGPWTKHIVVDAASAQLYYYEAGRQQGTMRVVVGAKESQTPMLAGRVRYAILNPYWNVPTDLVQRKLAPKVLAGASLKALRYQALSDWSANAATIDPATIDWHAVAAGRQEARIRQLPGGSNAMGRVKFMFPNNQGIYLHDTPEKALMKKPDRHLSNGCVRLEDAPRLGRWLMGRPLAPPGGKPEQDVPLATPVPVYLTYLTAVPAGKGIGFVNDAYGRDSAH